MKYTTEPLVVSDLFDADTYKTILRFMTDWVPKLPWPNDSYQPDKRPMFGRRFGTNVPFFAEIHQQLAEYASDLFDEEVKPSYSFLSMYDDNGTCPLHIDRPQCRYTIDYLIRQEQAEPWPICIGPQMNKKQHAARRGELSPFSDEEREHLIETVNWTTVDLKPNDAVCYSGTHAWHYRPEPCQGTADLVFFHFVPKGFRGDLD